MQTSVQGFYSCAPFWDLEEIFFKNPKAVNEIERLLYECPPKNQLAV